MKTPNPIVSAPLQPMPDIRNILALGAISLLAATATTTGTAAPPATPQVAEKVADPPREKTTPLFDGKTLKDWKITDFAGQGEVEARDGQLFLHRGATLTGVTYSEDFPESNYEVTLEAMRVDGNDFFCGMTFRVGKDPCSLIVGGWGGSVVGLSSINNSDASENETTRFLRFESGRWYPIRLRVTDQKIQAWIDGHLEVDVPRADREFSVRIEVEPSRPFGIASWQTTAALRKIVLRRLR